ncbi:CHAP domain-containing protein [Chromobacterium phragmitis]|uniref:CHAP domain-containing protein n=1 Tax=Chromobacterium phragmitis TaxID=2202141 RepID=A0A344UHV9_9NEIS|nr:CHAP domain-containing protein [Chromobacterium phragmitis]AXE34857.1 CHAP domain-containing protein [Chromobacterium phragmitis]
MTSQTKKLRAALAIPLLALAGYWGATHWNSNRSRSIGEVVDSLNGVPVYYNGGVQHVDGRNLAPDGYNLGLRFQCVEFVKRYYYQRFGHKMPYDKGHARDFFLPALPDGALNPQRGLLQFRNGGASAPQADDLAVFSPWIFNRYGHVAIVSAVGADYVEIIQQNPGPFGSSRERMPLQTEHGMFKVGHPRLQGWLRLPPPAEDEPAPAASPSQESQTHD